MGDVLILFRNNNFTSNKINKMYTYINVIPN